MEIATEFIPSTSQFCHTQQEKITIPNEYPFLFHKPPKLMCLKFAMGLYLL